MLKLPKMLSSWPYLAALIALGTFLTSCGAYNAGNPNPNPATGPDAVINGANLATATTHWVSSDCNVQVELTSDSGFWSIVVDTSGTKSSGSETWAVGPDTDSITIGPGSGLVGFFWVSALTKITGSTTSKAFTADAYVTTQSTQQNLGICNFTLANGTLP